MESPYIQAFCGQEYFALEDVINPGMLSERRKRLGPEFLALLDAELSAALKADKNLKFRPARSGAAPSGFTAILESAVDRFKNIFR
jgi:hypothetical protein